MFHVTQASQRNTAAENKSRQTMNAELLAE
jgi:hypothetical protein